MDRTRIFGELSSRIRINHCKVIRSRVHNALTEERLRSVLPRPRRDQAYIHRFEVEFRLVGIGSEIGFRGFQPVFVVALGKIGLVVCATRFVTHAGALRNDSRQLQHVIKLACEYE